MNAPHSPSPLASVPMAPADPILGVTEAFVADQSPSKVNLGVGVYTDDNGKIPLLECVKRAEELRMRTSPHRGYLPIDGLPAYDSAVQRLVFGKDSKETVTVQALGGTGGLKIGADFLKQINPSAQVWISEPSWENHRQLFEAAGFTVKSYPYYEPRTRGLDFAGMERGLNAIPAGSIVVLHACCHNPTGVDLDKHQWGAVLEIVRARGLIPFLDLAYQGFAEGVEEDAYAARLFAGAMTPVFLSSSFSKSVSLYGERVGALGPARAVVRMVSRGGLRPEDEGILAPVWKLPPEARRPLRHFWTQPKFFEALGSQIASVCESAAEVLAAAEELATP